MVFDDCWILKNGGIEFWKLINVLKLIEMIVNLKELLRKIIGSVSLQEFEELFSQNTDDTLPKFL